MAGATLSAQALWQPPATGLPQPRILMVDDRPDALLALGAVLEPLQAELVSARSGVDALRELLVGDFAVIILDVQMPGIDGFETARLIRQRERCRNVPIVFLTAISGEPQHFMAGYEAGGFDYLYKPYDPGLLRAKISVLLRLWSRDLLTERQHDELARQYEQLQRAHETVRRQSVELERSNAALERVSEAAAAGLRRPLCLAAGFSRLAGAEPDAARARDLLAKAVECADLAKSRLDELRTSARAQPPAGPAEDLDLGKVASEIVAELSSAPEATAGPRFELGGLPMVQADPHLLRDLLTELLVGAASRAGTGTVRLAAEADGGSWRLTVSDDGRGWGPLELVEALTSFGGGQSPGALALVKRYAERLGGSVEAAAGRLAGTTVSVILPTA